MVESLRDISRQVQRNSIESLILKEINLVSQGLLRQLNMTRTETVESAS